MKTLHKIISAILVIAAMTVTQSCKETFTEKDALAAQQAIDIALYIFNESDPALAAIAGAKVTISQNGVSKDATTDAGGAALYPGMKEGDFVYRVEAANFISTTGTASATSTNFRETQKTVAVGMVSLNDPDLATIKGTITMEKDLTTIARELAAAVDVFVTVYLNDATRIFTTKTDGNGVYSIKVPVNATGDTWVTLDYGDFEADQTIAVNKYSDDQGNFPTVLPKVDVVNTLFSMSTDGSQYINFNGAGNVRSVYGIADAAPSGGSTAIVSAVYTNGGKITGVNIQSGSDYTGDTDGAVAVTFTSLDGGTGASLVITLGTNVDLSDAYNGFGTGASSVQVGGSGYPESDFSLNKTDQRYPDARSGFNVHRGTVAVANGDFGTGIYRPRQPQ